MKYYLPININGRRIHILHLQEAYENSQPEPVFGFIIKDYDSPRIMSIDGEEVYLLSSNGSKNNVNLRNYHLVVEDDNSTEVPVYTIKIQSAFSDQHPDCPMKSKGSIGSSDPNKRVHVDLDSTKNNSKKLIIKVVFTDKDGRIYSDAFNIFLYKDEKNAIKDKNIITAALDFGSEASQIRTSGSAANMPIIDFLEKINGHTGSPLDEYWQGKRNDTLFKSVFFVNTQPKNAVHYAEKPLVYNLDQMILPLLKTTEKHSVYNNLHLLPNLKLVEISRQQIEWGGTSVNLPSDSEIEYGAFPTLADHEMRNSILRIILSNFLYSILFSTCARQTDKYLRLMLLVPNVYYQSKIYTIVRDLYKDFDTICDANDNINCKGIEIQVVSESDAAFFGAKQTIAHTFINSSNGHFLIIDAGKGTTDFSILQQEDIHTKFKSLYRDGIPASGNVLTYAFYEALSAHMNAKGFPLNELLKDAEPAQTLRFIDIMEQFKFAYDESVKDNDQFKEFTPNSIRGMTDLCTYLNEELKNKHPIPGCTQYLKAKINVLVKELEKSMHIYMDSKNIKFVQVLLTGRAFQLQLFKDAVKRMLSENNWIKDTDVIALNGENLKTICLDGALLVEKECSVNSNSGLIGNPKVISSSSKNFDILSIINKHLPSFLRQNKDENVFFYEGFGSVTDTNVEIQIGSRIYEVATDQSEEKKVYFVGDGFICISENSTEEIEEKNFQNIDQTIMNLVVQSLFPYHSNAFLKDSEEAIANYKPSSIEEAPAVVETTGSRTQNTSTQVNNNTSTGIIDIDD